MAHSEETKRKIANALRGKKRPPEVIAKLRGRKRSPEFCQRMRELALNRIPWNKGKKYGSNKYANSGQFQKGHKIPPEVRAKMSASHMGYTWSEKSRELNRQGQYRRFEKEIPGYSYQDDGRRIRRKMRLRKNGGHHSKKEWENLKAQHNFTCLACLKKEPEIKLTKDHITPVLLGGTDDIKNIQPLCKSCNSTKHSKELRYLGRV